MRSCMRITTPLAIGLLLTVRGCAVGPNYHRPSAPVAPSFKESPPEGWKQAQPNAGISRGKWWEIYNDPTLNAMEEQVNVSHRPLKLFPDHKRRRQPNKFANLCNPEQKQSSEFHFRDKQSIQPSGRC